MLKPKEVQKLRSLLKHDDDRLPIIFNALSDPKRCKVFRSFLKHDRLCVSDIARTLGISMSLASQQLKILEITGLLVREREGRTVYFRPNTKDALVRTIIEAVQ
ncbi:MAG TPA: metalloregulator ArsR/SmtB family transcription factor [Candidatus Paceibacterota bacterium]|nr:metalloregulator ArsR/SmtB family transcription factor [Candidatus Paceibacterota bacterium]